MDYKNLICIGGPKDGQVVIIRHNIPYVEFAQQIGDVQLLEETSPRDVSMDIIRYRREWLRDFDGTIYEVLLASGVTDPIRRLLVEYKPKTDSAGKA